MTHASSIEQISRLGVNGDSTRVGADWSIRDEALGTLNKVLVKAGKDGATGAAFEHQFNSAAKDALPPDALHSPTLRLMTDRLGSLPLEALDTTDAYLQSIGLKTSTPNFLTNALDSAARVINHYMDYTGQRTINPVDAKQLLRSPLRRSGRGSTRLIERR